MSRFIHWTVLPLDMDKYNKDESYKATVEADRKRGAIYVKLDENHKIKNYWIEQHRIIVEMEAGASLVIYNPIPGAVYDYDKYKKESFCIIG